jgi:hypothetical protein
VEFAGMNRGADKMYSCATFSRVRENSSPTPRRGSGAIVLGIALAVLTPLHVGESIAQSSGKVMPDYQELPDWSGVWQRIGTNVFDPATATPGGAGDPGVRQFPPLTPAWEKKYAENIEKVKRNEFPDPLTYCGIPAGFPRLMSLPDVYQFVVRPEQTTILTENGPNIMRIYTDGRPHLSEDVLWNTFTGDSVGHWEKDTLVFTTIGLHGDGKAIIDRTGMVLSDQARVQTRMRKVAEDILEANLIIEDPIALAKPWHVKRQYRRLAAGTRVYDYACAENNRNPVTADGLTLTLDAEGKVIDKAWNSKK